MSGKNIIFNDQNIKKIYFYKNKKISKTNNIDIIKISISKKESYGKKKLI